MAKPAIARTVPDLRAAVAAWRRDGLRVGLVPTMGALHRGHLSLIEVARGHADRVVVSLFVNPTQFAPHEDFERYPRDEGADAGLLGEAGCDLLYAPTVEVMYPQGFAASVDPGPVALPLEGEIRPTHFRGVATVVAKLLIQSGADVAVFGEKDYQQLQVIRRTARDLDIPAAIVGAPTIRAQDGLALSSRNAYLTDDQRQVAGRLNRALSDAAQALRAGTTIEDAEAAGRAALQAAGFSRIDYFTARDPDDLSPLSGVLGGRPARLLAAAVVGTTRLIDNMAV